MSKNNYKCLINTSAPSCVIIITISTGINHSYNVSLQLSHPKQSILRLTKFTFFIVRSFNNYCLFLNCFLLMLYHRGTEKMDQTIINKTLTWLDIYLRICNFKKDIQGVPKTPLKEKLNISVRGVFFRTPGN